MRCAPRPPLDAPEEVTARAPLRYARKGRRGLRSAPFRSVPLRSVSVPLRDGGARSPFRSASGAALHSRARSLRRPVRSTPLRPQGRAGFRGELRSATGWRRAFSVPFRERCGNTLARALVTPPRSLHSTTPAGRGRAAALHSRARSLRRRPSPPFPAWRYVPRVRRHYTRFARCAAALAPLHAKRGAPPPPPPAPRKLLRSATQIARGGRRLPFAPLRPPLHPARPFPAWRSIPRERRHNSLCSLYRRPRSTPRQAGSAATAAPPAQTAPLRYADCAGGAASLHSTPTTLRYTPLHYATLRPRRPLRA